MCSASRNKSLFCDSTPLELTIGDDAKKKKMANRFESRTWYPLTGDVVLMSRCPGNIASAVVSRVTASEWTHVGVVVAARDAVDASCFDRAIVKDVPLLLESVSSGNTPMFDALVPGEPRVGIRCVYLSPRLREALGRENRIVAVRRPAPKLGDVRRRVRQFMDRCRGGEYGIGFSRFFSLIRDERDDPTAEYRPSMLARRDQSPRDEYIARIHPDRSPTAVAFCSQLVAEFCSAVGVLPRDVDSGSYSPGDFAPGSRVDVEASKAGFTFGETSFMFPDAPFFPPKDAGAFAIVP